MGATGQTTLALDPEQQAFADRMQNVAMNITGPGSAQGTYSKGALAGAESMIPGLLQDPSGRETDIYNRIRAMQTPEEQRMRTGLESRLAAQGRTGVQTAAYGGTPEQLAMEKAIQEAQNQASVQAIGLGQSELGQQTQLASMLAQTGAQGLTGVADQARTYGMLQYAPQQAVQDLLGSASQAYQFEDVARRQAANQLAEAQMGGLEGMLGAGLGQANLMGEIGSGMVSGGMGMLGNIVGGGGNIVDGLMGLFGR